MNTSVTSSVVKHVHGLLHSYLTQTRSTTYPDIAHLGTKISGRFNGDIEHLRSYAPNTNIVLHDKATWFLTQCN